MAMERQGTVESVGTGSLRGKKVLVMGLGRFGGGVGVAKWLVGEGAVVTMNDAATADKLTDSMKALEGLPITYKLGGHEIADFLAADLIVVNPAVDRRSSDVLKAAAEKGVPMTTEINLFVQRCLGKTIGITGSVGKSTTTALIYEALKAGLHQDGDAATQETPRVFLGGNIGRSLLLELPRIRSQDWVILELSSFMLEETPPIHWSPRVAVVTNVFPNHLDRHGTMAAYAAAKQNILRFQHKDDVAILNNDHDLVSRWVGLARGRVVKFSLRGPAANRPAIAMPGEHNASNAAAAMAVLGVVTEMGTPLDIQAAARAIAEFPGLSHRLQLVHRWEPAPGRIVRFFNDSKATSPDASITALQAFEPGTAIFIVGGYDKHIDASAFEKMLAIRAAGTIGIGQTGEKMVAGAHAAGAANARYVGTLEEAVKLARAWAAQELRVSAIVLSPASASWDQFPNYEVRGDRFTSLARAS